MALDTAGYSSLIKELKGYINSIMPYLLPFHAGVLQNTSLSGFLDNKRLISLAINSRFN